ncbi:MAG: type I restriction-modification enzyme R subunit C-terminal domain-containing protein [Anaerolineaceae bacterium]|nr:type I restriction-modification enzyme R subunit C-terminal domain-containing protein [Anaerolineaceae bacterium]
MNLYAGRGVAVREFPLETGYADYLLFVDRRAVGIVEAKAEGIPLAGVAEQAARYAIGLPANIPHVSLPLPFLYESTGVETFFRDARDPQPRSRRVYAFHRPETLADWLAQPDTLRSRLIRMPDQFPLITANLWPAQVEAINNLERSFADDCPRALIQMATGSGKTFTAVNFVYRLIKHAKARRVLFLVDRNNLGKQAYKEFEQFVTPDDGRKFGELYNVQHLQSNLLDGVSKVHITTIQRLYSMLSGEAEFDPANEEGSLWEADGALRQQSEKEVRYNPHMPPEYYDFIVTDECHRSIYNLWRQALDYFDASLIGLTATPSKQTLGFFNQNLVMEYSRPRAVADCVNVAGEVYRIRTRITEQGSTIEKGWWVGQRDKRTRRQRWEQLEEDFSYNAEALDRQVSSPNQIRTILTAYRESLPELFPGRNEVPKTLIFAKDDNHAEEIVRIAREVFAKGDDFCQKITYRAAGMPDDLISAFRTSYNPRIAVTVDMIATGTDIKPLEALVFMRAVRSRLLFEQMLGRGTRVISDTDFQAVTTTPGAHKSRFVIVDVVGVTEQELVETGTVERKRSASLKSLLEAVAVGAADEDVISSLARRLALLERRLSPAQCEEVKNLLDVPAAPERFGSLRELSNALLDAIDPDSIREQAMRDGADPTDGPSETESQAASQRLKERALIPLAASPALRNFLLEREILIDETSLDEVTAAGFDLSATERARELVASFKEFILKNQDEITALQILFNRPYAQRRLDFAEVKALAEQLDVQLHQADPLFLTENLWQAYRTLEKERVHGSGERRMLADLVSLVRHAALDEELEPYSERVQRRYQGWLGTSGKQFSPAQRWWLDEIARSIGINLSVSLDDLNYANFQGQGGQVAAQKIFGADLAPLLEELNTALGE